MIGQPNVTCPYHSFVGFCMPPVVQWPGKKFFVKNLIVNLLFEVFKFPCYLLKAIKYTKLASLCKLNNKNWNNIHIIILSTSLNWLSPVECLSFTNNVCQEIWKSF